jgi:hypothetical protein
MIVVQKMINQWQNRGDLPGRCEVGREVITPLFVFEINHLTPHFPSSLTSDTYAHMHVDKTCDVYTRIVYNTHTYPILYVYI